jgi:hypothetical protein
MILAFLPTSVGSLTRRAFRLHVVSPAHLITAMSSKPLHIGERDFTDGATRRVYRDPDGRQFVEDDEGERVYGIWILQAAAEPDEPIVVKAR